MATLDAHAVYDELLDLLADGADVQRVLAFRLSSLQQELLDILLEKNREGTLTAEETAELDTRLNTSSIWCISSKPVCSRNRTHDHAPHG